MALIKQIKEPILNELAAFERLYKSSVNSTVRLTMDVTDHILSSNGKQIRPILTLLSAGVQGGVITEKTLRAAVALELLHTATLTHDDVIDNSPKRRNKETVNELWNNKIAILTGDYFLSVLLDILAANKDYDILQVIAQTVRQITEGEFLQQQVSISFDYSEEVYFEIIRKKTASLIAACCTAGAVSVDAPGIEVQKMHKIGELLGLVFQIKDDILDYKPDSQAGKLYGNDIRELKFTLPLIYYIEHLSAKEKESFLEQFRLQHAEDGFVKELIERVTVAGGIFYAEEKMQEYSVEIDNNLSELPNSSYKTALMEAVRYISDRND